MFKFGLKRKTAKTVPVPAPASRVADVIAPPKITEAKPKTKPVAAQPVTNVVDARVEELTSTVLRFYGEQSADSLSSIVRRQIGAAGLPSWDKHPFEMIQLIEQAAARLLTDHKYVHEFVDYYVRRVQFGNLEILIRMLGIHAICDALSLLVQKE